MATANLNPNLQNTPAANAAGAAASAGNAGRGRPRRFMQDDFPAIQRALVTCVTCVIVGAGLVISSQYLLDQEQAQVAQAQARDNQASSQRRNAEEERAAFDAYQKQFRQLGQAGFIGTEPRLEWIELVQRLQSAGQLEPIHYDISEQQPVTPDPATNLGAIQLHGSTMTLQINVLHEVDFLTFLRGMQTDQSNTLQNCHLHRFQAVGDVQYGPRVAAECTIVWLTVTLPDTSPAK